MQDNQDSSAKAEEIKKDEFKLSVSKAKTYLDCAKKFHFSYILKAPKKEGHIASVNAAILQ